MKTKSKRQIKNFILKTLLPYKQNPKLRATNNSGTCVYLTDDNRKCAVGKWMKKGIWQDHIFGSYNLFSNYNMNDILLKEARDMQFTKHQWELIQSYHDKFGDDSHYNNVENLENEFGIELKELYVS